MTEKREIPGTYRRFRQKYPDVARHYEALGDALTQAGPLDERTARLVKLAIAVGYQQEGAVHSAVRKGLEAGLTPDEMRQVALLAITTIGFAAAMAAYTWIEDIVGQE